MKRSPLQRADLLRIMANLNHFSGVELAPYRDAFADTVLVDELLATSPLGYTYATDHPVYAWGAEMRERGVYALWGFGADMSPGTWFSLTRALRRDILALFDRGATRLRSRGLGEYPHVVRWMKTLGASVVYERGPKGEDIAVYTWERP